ncbi:MAG: FAD-dependent oxidoreductase [SAR202 cluster bacterium]|nr:FAD-dependent oxidoreductase [Acidobacteriota bacterium]MDP6371527.1 FAD-dependent oxidoreductase [Vicinamibacterales bacterium]MQG56389.1 FAD-dependent oxidoreductase [SAR202 cluster bacterium]MQG67982.1 FAD-dependent oxidoreductase [SAR202 cluster bacterium]HAK57199.1 FAD-dependent oxidoreductase [Acidobacteriota bacterium]
MDRRSLLKTGGMAAVGLGLGGCATRTPPAARPSRPMLALAPIRASWDRVIRTTVGLRPHRPSGFMLRLEKLDAKTVVHNYGHGGSGLSLSWGTGALAADLALEAASGDRRAAVLGSGAVGLAATRQLQRRGFDVTIYTMAVPPDTTSNMALGVFSPTSGLVSGRGFTPAWEAQFGRAIEIAYRQLQLLAGSGFGITWMDSYGTMDELPTAQTEARFEREGARLMPARMRASREILYPGEHPFPTRFASRRTSMKIEPSLYLEAMLREAHLFGARTVIRKFDTPRDLMTLDESVIVNCTGLGASELFGDEELMPVKGQLTFLVPQPEVDYGYGCTPRSDGIALGGTQQRGVWTLEPDDEARQRIVTRAIERFAWMRSPAPAVAPSVETFFGEES